MDKIVSSTHTLVLLLFVWLLASCSQKSPVNPNQDQGQAIQKDSIPTTQQDFNKLVKLAPNGDLIVQELAVNVSKRSIPFNPLSCTTFTTFDMHTLVAHSNFPCITQLVLRNKQLNLESLTILAGCSKNSSDLGQICLCIKQSSSSKRGNSPTFLRNLLAKSQKSSLPDTRTKDYDQTYSAHNLSDLKNLTKLDLSFNPIKDFGIAVLAPTINGLNLQFLYLEDAQIGNPGIKVLAQHLKNFEKLEFLVLNNNKIGDQGLLALIPQLPKSLRHLELGGNRIGNKEESMEALAICLSVLTNLSVLRLDNNQIKDDGINALIRHWKKLTELASFNLLNNQISEAAKQEFKNKVEAVGMGNFILYLD